MLRDDKDMALNAVLVACRKAADHYRQAVDLADEPEWAGRFERLARRRHADADRIEALLRRIGYLPDEPDRDRQEISQLASLTRATVTENSHVPLSEKACALESDIEERIRDARTLTWPPDVLELLTALAKTSSDARKAMATDD